ncbi:hypothetical protein MAR_002460, partial [Mya arenaria]
MCIRRDGSFRVLTTYRSLNIIIHGPDQINGINDRDVMLGCLTMIQNQVALHQWFRDWEVFVKSSICVCSWKILRIMAIGPLSTAMPLRFHNHVSRDILKSYLAHNEEYGNKLQKQTFPADIPVIVKEYTNEVYPVVLKKLNHIGEDAVKEIHPWVLCTLIDWSHFDKVICCTANLTALVLFCREEIQVETVEENRGPFSSQPNTEDPSSDSSQVLNSDQANGKHSSNQMDKENVLKLIDLHSQHEQMFNKPSMKKKHVWSIIAAKLRDKTFEITPEKVEQKWKNMTKTFRDTVDHNNKSGNAPKQCPYFEELQEAYGYRPNVKPEFTCAAGCSDSSN